MPWDGSNRGGPWRSFAACASLLPRGEKELEHSVTLGEIKAFLHLTTLAKGHPEPQRSATGLSAQLRMRNAEPSLGHHCQIVEGSILLDARLRSDLCQHVKIIG